MGNNRSGSPAWERPLICRWIGTIVAAVAACGPEYQFQPEDPVFFAESEFSYVASSKLHESTQVEADRLALFGPSDLARTDTGYAVLDSGNDRLLLFDLELNLGRIVGGEGSGPGEFRFPRRLARWDDTLVVLDANLRRISRFSLDGDFISTAPAWGNPEDVALHPVLGVLIVTDADANYYLARPSANDPAAPPSPFAEIPSGLEVESVGSYRHRTNLVAVTPDGTIHVLDGRHLALVSYGPDGSLTSAMYLPEEERELRMGRNRRLDEALGGPRRVLASPIVNRLDPLPDGRLFATVPRMRTDPEHQVGYVLDPRNGEAIPVRLPPQLSEMGAPFLDGDRFVVARARTGMALFELALVERE